MYGNLLIFPTVHYFLGCMPLTLIDAVAAAKAVIAMANTIEANTICALCAILITVIYNAQK